MLFLHTVGSFLQGALLSVFAAFVAPQTEDLAVDGDEEAAMQEWGFCSAGSERSTTGRQWAKVSVSRRNADICIREFLGGEAPPETPSCWMVAKNLGCSEVVDL